MSLVALECDRAKGSYKECRGRKFRPVGNFEVSILYSAADTKKSKDGSRKNSRIYNRIDSAAQHVDPEIGM